MTSKGKLRLFAILAGTLTLLVAGWWYQGSARPLTPAEVDGYMGRLETQTQVPGGRHNLPALRKFLESDDGRPFYVVNLFKFHDKAQYAPGSLFAGTGREAYARFIAIMVPLQAQRASHVVFASNWVDYNANRTWDAVAVVRYRSRRDIVDIFATETFADAATHKWAAIERNERMQVQGFTLPGGYFLSAALALLVAFLVYVAGLGLQRLLRRYP